MFKNALFATVVVFIAAVYYLMDELPLPDPLPRRDPGAALAARSPCSPCALFLNLLAGFFVLSRWLLLKDTGEKLAHIEKQLRGRESISEELSRRIAEQE